MMQAGSTAVLGGFLLARSVHKRRLRQALLQLPAARRSDHADEYFGHTVEDPYRWMERERASLVASSSYAVVGAMCGVVCVCVCVSGAK